jgi:catechol 2,3-dioxygenase-like lactoylglutathione lyase family enzyme
MITAIRHVGLVVTDIKKSLKFWCETMGFVVSRQMEETGPHIDAMMGLKNVRVTTAKLSAPDGNLLELLCFHSHPDKGQWEGTPYSTGLTHIALTVSDLDETCRRLKEAGVKFPAEPQTSPDGNAKVIYATGPEGILLELVEVIRK